MNPVPLHRHHIAVVILIGLTAVGLALSGSGIDPTLGSLALLAIAAFKARLVVLDYLGLRHAPGPWRAILTLWIALVATASATSALVGVLH